METLEFFEKNRERIIELQKLLTSHVAIAPEGGGDGESEKVAALKEWLLQNGFNDVAQFDIADERVSQKVRPSLVATIPGQTDSGTIWVIAHTDVVPVGDLALWETNPFECVVKGDLLYGRGVEDNQQGLCSAVFAALYFIENKITPQNTIKLLFVADEENGSQYGIISLMEKFNLFSKDDLVVIPDGGDEKGETIEIAEKNILWLKVHVKGVQTHGSRPDSGKNACLAACDLSVKLHELENVFSKKDDLFTPNYSTFQPTKRCANVDSVNIIPGEDTFYMDCRILPCYPLKDVLQEVDEVCSEIEAKYGVKTDYECVQKSESPATKESAKVAQKLACALKTAHGIDAKFIGIGGGTVGAELRRAGIDAVVWSTLDDQAHQPNEYCKISNLVKDAQTLVELFV